MREKIREKGKAEAPKTLKMPVLSRVLDLKLDKAEFVETMLHRKLGKMDILVDDHTPNLTRWETAGGTGIKWLNGINGKNGRFEGIRLGSVEELKAAFDEIADRK